MQLITTLLLTATAGFVASAQPYHNNHKHHHHAQKRDPAPEVDIIRVPGPTVFIYELGGHQISAEEVQEGLKNGSLVYASGESIPSSTLMAFTSTPTVVNFHAHTQSSSLLTISTTVSSTIDLSTVTSQAPSTTSTVAPTTSSTTISSSSTKSTTSSSTTSTASTTSSTSATSTTSSTSTTSTVVAAQTSATSYSSSSGSYPAFPDGELDCSTFPSAYGAVALDYLGLGGWAGIQSPGSTDGGYSDIMTVDTNTCTSGENCCDEGMFCSYACAPGYQKSQWPTTQGSTGQSVGGIKCLNGKLQLTNPSMSTSLCMPGTQVVSVMVENTLNKNVAVCRTDYPGTEGETIPLDAQPGTTNNLTCPAANNYYTWKGLSTSAQYYVNPAGVASSIACQWGSPSNDWGNYAPMNLGVGYSDGMAWLSIFQNSPTTNAKLGFTVELVGDNGGYDNLVGRCKYENGQYCSGDSYETCSSTTGCTVSLSSGTATYVFS